MSQIVENLLKNDRLVKQQSNLHQKIHKQEDVAKKLKEEFEFLLSEIKEKEHKKNQLTKVNSD